MDVSNVGSVAQLPDSILRQGEALLQRHSGHTVHQAAQDFEAYFISYLLKTMRETVPTGFLDRKGEQVWYSFYDQEIGRLATEAGGIGLTSFIEDHMPGQ
jgi:flagellar protein FlgJ